MMLFRDGAVKTKENMIITVQVCTSSFAASYYWCLFYSPVTHWGLWLLKRNVVWITSVLIHLATPSSLHELLRMACHPAHTAVSAAVELDQSRAVAIDIGVSPEAAYNNLSATVQQMVIVLFPCAGTHLDSLPSQ